MRARSQRRSGALPYVPLQRAQLPMRQDDEIALSRARRAADADSGRRFVPWGEEDLDDRLDSHTWGRMSAPRVRERAAARSTSKELRQLVRDRDEYLTTDFLNGAAPTSTDLATLAWDAIYRAELDARLGVPADADSAACTESSDSTGRGADAALPPGAPPPDPASSVALCAAGHSLTIAARAPGAHASA
jgi:hypothetical protein